MKGLLMTIRSIILAGTCLLGLFLLALPKVFAVEREEMDKVQERIAELQQENPELATEMRQELKEAIGRGEIVIQRDEKEIQESDRAKAIEMALEASEEKAKALSEGEHHRRDAKEFDREKPQPKPLPY